MAIMDINRFGFTQHAKDMAKQRFKWDETYLRKIAAYAWEESTHTMDKNNARRYKAKFWKFVFVFEGLTLITVYRPGLINSVYT